MERDWKSSAPIDTKPSIQDFKNGKRLPLLGNKYTAKKKYR